MASTVVNFAIRGFQVVFAAVVLGLSVSLVRGQAPGANSPISLRYTSFVGGLSLVTAFVGIAGEFFTLIQGKISLIMDTIVALVNIAGGVVGHSHLPYDVRIATHATSSGLATCYPHPRR